MTRDDWRDVCYGLLAFAAAQALWGFVLRDVWSIAYYAVPASPVFHAGVTVPVLLYHWAALGAAGVLATRTLRDPTNIWRRLFPTAICMVVIVSVFMASGSGVLDDSGWIGTIAFWLLAVDLFYTLMWVALRLLWRRRRPAFAPSGTLEPVWRRPGVRLWSAIAIVGTVLQLCS